MFIKLAQKAKQGVIMKILELTNYTAGGCGVGMRVMKESQLLAQKGHTVKIFSTNRTKGSDKICSVHDKTGDVVIQRFSAKKLGGESYMLWDFTKEAIEFRPDVIIAHAYRHLHTTQALKIARILKCKLFLVTHAPFGREKSRTFMQNIIVNGYDKIIGRKILKKFTKIIAITKWEQNYLYELGLKDKNIVHLPNGLTEEFFKKQINRKGKISKIIYLGRISSIKNLETVIKSLSQLSGYTLEIRGSGEEDYVTKLNMLVKEYELDKIVSINSQPYNLKEQLRLLDNFDIYILPSISEGMPQALIEAMARQKIVISSDNLGSSEIISNGKNGFLFPISNYNSLSSLLKKLKSITPSNRSSIQINAGKTAELFKWSKIVDKLEFILKSSL